MVKYMYKMSNGKKIYIFQKNKASNTVFFFFFVCNQFRFQKSSSGCTIMLLYYTIIHQYIDVNDLLLLYIISSCRF